MPRARRLRGGNISPVIAALIAAIAGNQLLPL
jgi:hypothetical protein